MSYWDTHSPAKCGSQSEMLSMQDDGWRFIAQDQSASMEHCYLSSCLSTLDRLLITALVCRAIRSGVKLISVPVTGLSLLASIVAQSVDVLEFYSYALLQDCIVWGC